MIDNASTVSTNIRIQTVSGTAEGVLYVPLSASYILRTALEREERDRPSKVTGALSGGETTGDGMSPNDTLRGVGRCSVGGSSDALVAAARVGVAGVGEAGVDVAGAGVDRCNGGCVITGDGMLLDTIGVLCNPGFRW